METDEVNIFHQNIPLRKNTSMNRLILTVCLSLFFFACSEKPSAPVEQAATTSAAPASTEVSFGKFIDLPEGAIKEELSDTPGLVKIKVGNEASGIYKEGKRNGSWIEYHPGGLVKTITSYVDGKKEGLFVELTNNGQLVKRCMYHNNLRHGEYKELNYINVKEERFYQNDKLEGIVKVYYDNAKIMEEGSYKNGTRDGISKWYDKEGKVSITYEYKSGQLINK